MSEGAVIITDEAGYTPFRHSRESGNPGPQAPSLALDARFRGHDGGEEVRP
jgi:hypothetical protein